MTSEELYLLLRAAQGALAQELRDSGVPSKVIFMALAALAREAKATRDIAGSLEYVWEELQPALQKLETVQHKPGRTLPAKLTLIFKDH